MQIAIYFDKKVVDSALKHYILLCREAFHEFYHRVAVPHCAVALIFAESVLHIPIIGERTDVHTAAHAAATAKHIGMAKRQEQRTVTAHTESGDGAHAGFGDGAEVIVDKGHQVGDDKCFELRLGIDG